MKLKDILKAVGPAALSIAYPPAAPVIAAVSALMTGDKLPANCTGDQLSAAIAGLSPEVQGQFLDAEYEYKSDLVKAHASAINTANTAGGENYQKTRAFIAKWSFIVVAAVTVGITAAWIDAVIEADKDVIKEIGGNWPMVIALLAPFFSLLYAYMGVLKQEYRDRLNAQNGKTATSGLAMTLHALTRGKK